MTAALPIAEFSQALVLFTAAALFIWAAFTDIRSFKIPNRISLSLLALYPAYLLAAPAPFDWSYLAFSVGFAVVIFGIGFALFAMRAMGGGDVKLLTVGALWAGPAAILPFILLIAVATLGLAIIYALKSAVEQPVPLREAVAGLRFAPLLKLSVPYGAAIAVGGLFVVGRLALA